MRLGDENHVRTPGLTIRVRTDLSATLFLSHPASYEGGELVIEDNFGERRVKLAAGDMVLYPGTSIHHVTPVTRGERVASFFWIQSAVRFLSFSHAEGASFAETRCRDG